MNDGTQLARIEADRSRTTGQLRIRFDADHEQQIGNAVSDVIQLVTDGMPLAEACNRVAGRADKPKGIDWQQIADDFLATRAGHRKTTLSDTTKRINNALTLLLGKSPPRDAKALLRQYAKQFFDKSPAGGTGRKRHFAGRGGHAEFAVDRAVLLCLAAT